MPESWHTGCSILFVDILVVEDEELLRRMLVSALEVKGHRVETCEDGEQGLARLEAARFDALVTDFRMPKLTGLALIRELRARGRRIPTVLMSSNTLEEMGVTAEERGAFEYLRKPYGLRELYSALQRVASKT